MTKYEKAACWLNSGFLIGLGVWISTTYILAGTFFIVCSCLTLPPLRRRIKSSAKIVVTNFSNKDRSLIVLSMLVITGLIAYWENNESIKQEAEQVALESKRATKDKIQVDIQRIKDAQTYYFENRVSILTSAKKQLNNAAYEEVVEGLADYYLNIRDQELNDLYMAAVERKKEKDTRIKKTAAQFSNWDGSHRQLSHLIKQSMNDPESYSQDETMYWEHEEYLIVKTEFHGKNSFGAIVRSTVKAKVDLEGNVLEILEQY